MTEVKTSCAPRWLCLAAPSALTLGALACSLTAMRVAFAQQWSSAAALIIAAAVCDGLDGHLARLLDAVTVFGGELDSLGDLVNFGVAPALVMFAWADQQRQGVSHGDFWDVALWASCVIFCQACALRLARFNCSPGGPAYHPPPGEPLVAATSDSSTDGNTSTTETSQKGVFIARSKFFNGVPAPMGAMLALLPLFWQLDSNAIPFGWKAHQVAVMVLLISAVLMVSHLKTLSSKMFMRDPKKASHLRIRSPWEGMLKLAGVLGAVAAAFLCSPWRMVLVMECTYVVSLFAGPVVYHLLAE